jgi:RNA 2',3'-cyclic 3'-phosphodiesterase
MMSNTSKGAGKIPALPAYRTFIAIEIPGDLRTRITQHIARLRSAYPDVRASWTRTENLHLTLKFLGNVPVDRIGTLSHATDAAARSATEFKVSIGGVGIFPPAGRPNVLWIGIADASGKLSDLYDALEDHCAETGFQREARAYHPHLTIARLRNRGGSRALAELHQRVSFPSQTFTVSELVVFRSELLSEGSKHTAISRHQLSRSVTVDGNIEKASD